MKIKFEKKTMRVSSCLECNIYNIRFTIFPKKKSKFNSINICKNSINIKINSKDKINMIDYFKCTIEERRIIEIFWNLDFDEEINNPSLDFEKNIEEINFDEEINNISKLDSVEINNLKRIIINKEKYYDSIKKLEEIIYNDKSTEKDCDVWINNNKWLFTSIEIKDKPIINNNNISKPDFNFSNPFGKGKNILEIKKPNEKILQYDENHKNWFWTRNVSSFISQVRKYLDAYSENPHTGDSNSRVRETINPYGIILCGKYPTDEKEKWIFESLNNELRSIKIFTYDTLLENLIHDYEKKFGEKIT